MKIYVVRHGQTDYNVKGIFQGQTDTSLNSVGIEQAKETAKKFKDIKINNMIVSPLTRTRQTAKYISEVTGIKPVIEKDLIERGFGEMEGKSNGDDCNYNYKMLMDYEKNYNIYGAEPIKDLIKRISLCMDRLIKQYDKKDIVLVTHGGVSIAIDCYFNGIPEDRDLEKLALKNCEVREYSIL